jgi:hypothetical protein
LGGPLPGPLVASGQTPIALNPCDILKAAPGYRAQISSGDGRTTLAMQSDGNLVLRQQGKAVWWTGTQKRVGNYAQVQTDGNLVVRSAQGKALWNSKTANPAISRADASVNLLLYDNGNLILRTTLGTDGLNFGRVLWQTKTAFLK